MNAALRIYNERLQAGTVQTPDLVATAKAALQAPAPADGAFLVSAAANSTACPDENPGGSAASAGSAVELLEAHLEAIVL